MIIEQLIAYLAYALVTAWTPGPNNIMALYAVSRSGWGKGKYVIAGITTGFYYVMLLCAIFCHQLVTLLPAATGVLKYVGAVYIFWLAWHVARSGHSETEGKEVSFWDGFCLQFINVKIYMYAITIYTGYVLTQTSSFMVLVVHSVLLTLIGFSGIFTWGVTGGILQSFLGKYYKPFNYMMGAVLAWCAVSLLQ